ncbi:MAG: TetR/AcrR family transcriptional regulator [Hyphomicrobiales bacterium]
MRNPKTSREELVAAATQLLAEESISHFSIGRVCARAGVSRRSFFNYFKDKDDLLTEVLGTLRESHMQAMQQWSADLPPELGVEERIRLIFTRILTIIQMPDWRGSAFIRLSGELSTVEGHPIHEVVAQTKRDQEKWFEEELVRGKFTSPSELATQLTIIMTGLFQLQLVHRAPYLGEAVLSLIPRLLASSRLNQ